VAEVLALCERWETGSAMVGEVTDSGSFRVLRDGEVVGEMPVAALVDDCPLYDLHPEQPEAWIYGNLPAADLGDAAETLQALLGSPSVASKRWAFEQYDSIVGSHTVRLQAAADAAVLHLPEAETTIAISIDGNGRRVACDPYAGTIEAVLECAANLACVGAEPLGLTNCLNFGNPEKPTVAWQLDRSTQALADACEALEVPVVGGNVSLYNETEEGPIYPTPVIGMVGELPEPTRAGGAGGLGGLIAAGGDQIAICGPFAPSLAGSQLAKLRGELGPGLPSLPIDQAKAAIAAVRRAVRGGGLSAAHDVSDGGLACALAELAIAAAVGLEVDLDPLVEQRGCSGESALFGEGPGGFVVAGSRSQLEALAAESGAPVLIVGSVGGERISISAAELELELTVADAERAWSSLGERMDRVEIAAEIAAAP